MQWWRLIEQDDPVPVRYRTMRDLAGIPGDHPDLSAAADEVLAYPPALAVAGQQDERGSWNGRLHTGDSRAGVRLTTEIQFPRLIEYGWTGSHPVVARTVDRLLCLLADPEDVNCQFPDILSYMTGPRRTRYFAQFSRFICAGLLAHAGCDHPLVLRAARDYVLAAFRFVTGPVASAPFSGDPPAIVDEAFDPELGYPAIPDLYWLQLVAACPSVRGELGECVSTIIDYVLSDRYRRLDDRLGLVTGEGRPFVKGWKIDLLPPEVLAETGRWAYGLIVLELLARAGCGDHPGLARHHGWLRRFRTEQGLYDLPARSVAVRSSGPFAERVQLAPDWRRPRSRVADLTFRIRLIQSLSEGRMVP